MSAIFDKTGREIMRGDIVKVYHFTASVRRKKHYMYKQALGPKILGKGDAGPYMEFSHLDFGAENTFYEHMNGKRLVDFQIVQSIDAKFMDRPRAALGVSREEARNELARREDVGVDPRVPLSAPKNVSGLTDDQLKTIRGQP